LPSESEGYLGSPKSCEKLNFTFYFRPTLKPVIPNSPRLEAAPPQATRFELFDSFPRSPVDRREDDGNIILKVDWRTFDD